MNNIKSPPAKKRPGTKRLPEGVPLGESTHRSRAFRDRKRFENQATEIAENALTYQLKTLAPGDLDGNALRDAQDKTQRALKLVLDNAEGITKSLVDRALQGDIQAAQLLVNRFLPERRQILKFKIKPTADATAYGVLEQASVGELSVQDAQAALNLLEKVSDVSLSGALADRLKALTERVEALKANKNLRGQGGHKTIDMGLIDE
jgi:hypothetical protein